VRLRSNEQKSRAESGSGGNRAETGGEMGESHRFFLFSFAKFSKTQSGTFLLRLRFALLENQLRITTYYFRFLVAT
jgi:hypothetical protein